MGVVQKILGKAEFKDNKSEYFMIEFNKNNWEIYINWKKVWDITPETNVFRFFEYLYDNMGLKLTHKDIHKYVFEYEGERQQSRPIKTDLSDLKRKLPEEIKSLVSAPAWHYMIT